MAFLREYADRNACTLYTALTQNLEDEIFKGTKATAFVRLIESFAATAAGRPQERLDNLAELKQSVFEYEISCGEEATLEHYLSHIALFSNSDAIEDADRVKLMTVHAAKGLEFPVVFLCELNEGIFPSRKTRTLPGPLCWSLPSLPRKA